MRIVLTVVGIVSALIAPPWLTALCMLALCLRWRAWEVVAIGVVTDVLWYPDGFWHVPLATLFSVALLVILEPLRNELLVERNPL